MCTFSVGCLPIPGTKFETTERDKRMKPGPLTSARMVAALRDAFEAGREQGSDEATAYEWGSLPNQKADKAFADLFAKWETGHDGRSHIRKALMRCKL